MVFRVAEVFGWASVENWDDATIYKAAEYLSWKAEQERKAIDEAKRRGG